MVNEGSEGARQQDKRGINKSTRQEGRCLVQRQPVGAASSALLSG